MNAGQPNCFISMNQRVFGNSMTAIPPLKDGEQKVFFKAGGEWCYLWTPEGYENGKPVPVVIHNHGAL